MKRVALLIMLGVLAGCATTALPPPERQIEVSADPDRALAVGLDVLVERGFVIRLADIDLGRINAVRASRPAYEVQYEARETLSGTQIVFSGRHGASAIEPYRFDVLLSEISARLGENR